MIKISPTLVRHSSFSLTLIVDASEIKVTSLFAKQQGLMLMMFTCSVCNNRQGRTFSKDAYQKGVVLIRCDGCDNLHLIADNLGWFKDEKVNIEDIMKEKGGKIYKMISNESMEFVVKDEGEEERHVHGEHCQHHHHHEVDDHHHDHS